MDDAEAWRRETPKQRRERVGFFRKRNKQTEERESESFRERNKQIEERESGICRERNKQIEERERECWASSLDPRPRWPHPCLDQMLSAVPFSRSPLSTKPSSPRTPELARFPSSVCLRVSQSRQGPEEGEGRGGDGRGRREKSGSEMGNRETPDNLPWICCTVNQV